MNERSVAGFAPSTHGFHFSNAWPSGPTLKFGPIDPRRVGVGDAASGLCGGMCYTVADLFLAGVPMPADTSPPASGTRRFRAIVRRQVESLRWLTVPLGFWLRSALGGSVGGGRARSTYEDEWPKVRAMIDAGRLAPIGLIRVATTDPRELARNHQVIAWAYAEDGRGVTLRLYDPNWPDRDDVTIRLDLDRAFRPIGLHQSTGEPLLGWWLLPYSPRDPRAWR